MSFQNSYVKQMLTVIKRGFVQNKSVNAFQDGIHRKIAKVSAKSQPYITEVYLKSDSKKWITLTLQLQCQWCLSSVRCNYTV